MKKLLLASCIAFAFSTPAYSALSLQDEIDPEEEFGDEFDDEFGDFYGGEAFVSIATGTKKSLDKAPAIASVITSQDMRRMGAKNLVEALSLVPGLNISRNSQIMAPKFNFRGITTAFSPQTLIMFNGSPTTSTIRGDNQVVWGEYPIHHISRIEIIRGPGSALYGADAFAGVINIITKDATELQNSEAGVVAGSFGTGGVWLNTGTKLGQVNFGFALDYLESDGHDEIIRQDAHFALDQLAADIAGLPPVSNAPGSVNIGFKSLDLLVTAEYENTSARFSIKDLTDVGTGQGAAEALDPNGRLGSKKIMLDIKHVEENFTENVAFTGHFNYYKTGQEVEENVILFPAGTLFGAFPDGLIGNPGYDEDRITFDAKFDFSGLQDHFVSIGLGYSNQDLYRVTESKNFFDDLSPRPNGLEDVSDTSEVFIPEADRNNRFLFIQDIWQVAPDWELTTGIRYDDYSDFGSTVNPRVALVWSKGINSTVKFLYGRAFRAPSFAELLTVNNPVSLGNPDLSPETIDSLEAAYTYKHDENHSSKLNIFYYKIDDFINFIQDPGLPTSTAQNVGERTGYGIELETSFSLTDTVGVKTNYSYVKAEDDLLNDDVGDYPNHQIKGELNWKITDFIAVDALLNYVGERKRTGFDTRNALDSYTNLTLNVNYHSPSTGWHAEFSIKNVLDDDIFEPSPGPSQPGGISNIPFDIPQAGVSYFLQVGKSF